MPAIGIISLAPDGEGDADNTPPENIITGNGQGRVWNAHSDATGQFHTGQWQGSPGILRVAYTESETCVILTGRVRVTDANGGSAEFGPGEAFVVAAGFTGTWENIGQVTKIYAIFEPAR